MKLWEAMLKGAKKGPQLFNTQGIGDGSGGSCAYGAIVAGFGYRLPSEMDEVFPELNSSATCPEGPCDYFTSAGRRFLCSPDSVGRAIVHLNNDHRWSRQRIAEWLANRDLKFKPMDAAQVAEEKELVGVPA